MTWLVCVNNMAAQDGPAYSRWLLDCKSEIIQTDEWKDLSEELHRAIQQQLTESHVSKFTDLSDAEKHLFLGRAAKAIQQGDIFQNFNLTASKALDQHLSNHTNQQLLTSPTEIKMELILHHARECALGLLKRWPGNKAKLHRFFNQALPDRLRQITWRLFLRSPKVRSLYLEQLKTDPNSVMSILDLEVIQTSESLLVREPTFQELSNNTDILHAMKAVLSYYHVCKKTKSSLIDTDYMLVIPFLVNLLSTARPDQLVLESTLSLLIEQYVTFMVSRPVYMRESYVQDFQGSMESFAQQVAGMLSEKDESLALHMDNVFSGHFAGASAIVQGIKPLIRPMVRCLFVGYLSLDTVMYVWDQYIIGLDRPDYDVIPSMAVSVLMLLRKDLLECNSLPAMERELKRNARKLTKDGLIYEISHHFYQELCNQLNSGQDGAPVLDPTKVAMPWEHWHKEMLPQRTKAQDRRQERNIRDDERYEEARQKLEEDDLRVRQVHDIEREARREQLKFRQLLDQEKQKQEKTKKESQAEINKLKQEIENLKQGKPTQAPEKPSTGPANKKLAPRELDDPVAAKAIMTDMLKDFADSTERLKGSSSAKKVQEPGTSSQRVPSLHYDA